MITKLKKLLKRITLKIKEFEEEEDTYPYEAYERGPLWYLSVSDAPLNSHLPPIVPHPIWIDHALDADYLMHTQWQNLPSYYTGRDLRTVPDWDLEGKRNLLWWSFVIFMSVFIPIALIYGFMHTINLTSLLGLIATIIVFIILSIIPSKIRAHAKRQERRE